MWWLVVGEAVFLLSVVASPRDWRRAMRPNFQKAPVSATIGVLVTWALCCLLWPLLLMYILGRRDR